MQTPDRKDTVGSGFSRVMQRLDQWINVRKAEQPTELKQRGQISPASIVDSLMKRPVFS